MEEMREQIGVYCIDCQLKVLQVFHLNSNKQNNSNNKRFNRTCNHNCNNNNNHNNNNNNNKSRYLILQLVLQLLIVLVLVLHGSKVLINQKSILFSNNTSMRIIGDRNMGNTITTTKTMMMKMITKKKMMTKKIWKDKKIIWKMGESKKSKYSFSRIMIKVCLVVLSKVRIGCSQNKDTLQIKNKNNTKIIMLTLTPIATCRIIRVVVVTIQEIKLL